MTFRQRRCVLALSALAMMSGASCEAADPGSPASSNQEKPMSGLKSSRPWAPQVQPVTIGAVSYQPTTQDTIAGPEHAPGFLGAYDATTGARLWTLKVYERPVDARLEKDVQQDHFKTLTSTADGKLQVVTETGRRYEVDLAARSARALP